jgi:hypothetical protein
MKLCIELPNRSGKLFSLQVGSMPYWMLKCPKCSRDFVHTKIELAVVEEAHRDPYRVLPRPTFAPDGENHTCPGCKTESVFQRQQLFYRADTTDFDL